MKPDTSAKTTSPASALPTAVLNNDSPGKGVHRLGNLTYTTRGLIALFAWLLWFDRSPYGCVSSRCKSGRGNGLLAT